MLLRRYWESLMLLQRLLRWMTTLSKLHLTTSKGSYGLVLKACLRGYWGDAECHCGCFWGYWDDTESHWGCFVDYFYWWGSRGQHAIIKTKKVNDWLRSLDNCCILPKKQVIKCFSVPFNVLSWNSFPSFFLISKQSRFCYR